MTSEPTSDTERVLDLIRSHGGRASVAGRVVLEALINATGHVTAEELADEIHRQHPEIHQSTVYRNLERLEALGVAYHTHMGHGPAQWQLSSMAHPHLTCERCGAVTEAPPELFVSLQSDIEESLGFLVNLRHFSITGTCRNCSPGD